MIEQIARAVPAACRGSFAPSLKLLLGACTLVSALISPLVHEIVV
jgi:hypothetical protein